MLIIIRLFITTLCRLWLLLDGFVPPVHGLWRVEEASLVSWLVTKAFNCRHHKWSSIAFPQHGHCIGLPRASPLFSRSWVAFEQWLICLTSVVTNGGATALLSRPKPGLALPNDRPASRTFSRMTLHHYITDEHNNLLKVNQFI